MQLSTGRLWRSLGGAEEALNAVLPLPREVPLASALPVSGLAEASVASASLAMAVLAAERTGDAIAPVALDPDRVAASYASDRLMRVAGGSLDAWAPLSGFWPTADGWLRTHANYPHHLERLVAALALAEATPESLAAALAAVSAVEAEERIVRAGGVAAAVRRAGELALPDPAPAIRRIGGAAPREWRGPADASAPATGLRVLDLTRVIAGPVSTRSLAYAGAEVLRIDAPWLPELPAQHLDTGQGKRSALLDVATRPEQLEALLASADVVVTGYRPGALPMLEPELLAETHPGLVVGRLSAWGTTPGFEGRRGFDSIVQAASGIATLSASQDGRPGALPAQALDHGAGYQLAAALALLVARQRREGGTWLAELSLAGMARLLLEGEGRSSSQSLPADASDLTEEHDTQLGRLTTARVALAWQGAPGDYRPARPWGADRPEWASI